MIKRSKDSIITEASSIIGIVLIVGLVAYSINNHYPLEQTYGQTIQSPQVGESPITTECNDGLDNDNDRTIDVGDIDCISPNDAYENSFDECQDTDGGFYPEKKGAVYGLEQSELFSSQDKCVNTNKLQEFVCVGQKMDSTIIACKDFSYSICREGGCEPQK